MILNLHMFKQFKMYQDNQGVTNNSNGLSEIDIPGPLTYRYLRA